MPKRRIIFLLLCFIGILCTTSVFAQHRSCDTDKNMQLKLEDPDFKKAYEQKQEAIQAQLDLNEKAPCTNPLIVPIVVHYESGTISNQCMIDAAIAQIDQLNLDFSSCNANVGELCNWINAGCTIFGGAAGANAMPEDGSCIQFCLADQNLPAGEDNIGGYAITSGDYNSNNQDANSVWNSYLNCYIGAAGGALGFVPYLGGAGDAGTTTQGASVLTSTWGSATFAGCEGVGTDNTFSNGATATHEVGHWFGLEHTFSDNVTDTPSQSNPNYGCPTMDLVNCTTSVGTDYSGNFMDYVDDDCMHNFSADQVTIMTTTAAAQTSWATGSVSCYALWQNGTNSYTSCESGPCGNTNPPVASFTYTPSTVEFCPGLNETLIFSDASSNTPTAWSWIFSGAGVSPTSSTNQNPSVTVSSGGTLTAELMATNANGNDTKTSNIIVTNLSASDPTCNLPVAALTPANGTSFDICNNSTIDFVDNTVGNPSTWSWTFSGAGVSPTTSTSQNPSVSLSTLGTLIAELTVTNDVGTDVITYSYPVNVSCLCNTAGTSIPDNDSAGLDSDLIEGTGGTITDVNIELDITHTYIADLVISLTFNGTTIVLGDPDNNCNENNIIGAIFDDESTNGTFSSNGCSGGNGASPAYSGDYQPESPLSVFNGMDKAGTWTLNVVDNEGQDVGTLDSWCLDIQSTFSCPLAYTVSGNENGTGAGSGGLNTNGDYETDGSIVSTQIITNGTVDYDSAIDITLNPDFEVVLGALFSAFIDGCNGTGGEINPLIGEGETEMRRADTNKKQIMVGKKKDQVLLNESTTEKRK